MQTPSNAAPESSLPRRARRPRHRRFFFKWIPLTYARPREAFRRIVAEPRGVWQAALLLLTLTALLRVFATGFAGQRGPAAMPEIPEDFEFWSAEEQQQFMESAQVANGPLLTYALPALQAVGGVWLGWLIVGGTLHLVLTLLGGRAPTITVMNVVAWARLPLAVRDVVRLASALAGDPVTTTGLAGFAPADGAGGALVLGLLLGLIDLYLIWQIALVTLGVRRADPNLSTKRALAATLVAVGLLLLVQIGIGFGIAQIAGASGTIRSMMF